MGTMSKQSGTCRHGSENSTHEDDYFLAKYRKEVRPFLAGSLARYPLLTNQYREAAELVSLLRFVSCRCYPFPLSV